MTRAAGVRIREARRADAPALARLHAARISEGFLPRLGVPFLTRLYRRMLRAPGCAVVVLAEDGGETDGTGESGDVLGFAAATEDVGRLYREFLLRDGVLAGLRAAPRIVRSLRRVVETLRYPASTGPLPDAEILAVAVHERAEGRGHGRRLVARVTEALAGRGVTAVKVVAGADNAAALRMYERAGFGHYARREVHEGVVSEVLLWPSP